MHDRNDNYSKDNPMKRIYFVGAGGIGMANLERYALSRGLRVAGYDLTASALTDALMNEGAELVFDDNPELIPQEFLDPEETLVVRTPAVPDSNLILSEFRRRGHQIVKRAALLGRITSDLEAICVAGSHGKTTTSSMIAHILSLTPKGTNAFLGGILRNTGSNLMLSPQSGRAVVEADEYDRSFHHLSPTLAIITSTDPDHLDIYGDEEGYLEGFARFTELIRPGGRLLLHTGLKLHPRTRPDVTVEKYCGPGATAEERAEADWRSSDIRFEPGRLFFTLEGPDGLRLENLEMGVPVEINIDNAVAAAAACLRSGAGAEDVRRGLASFRGAERRFQIWLRGDSSDKSQPVLIDDYAHSPAEVAASISSVRKLYPGRHLTVIFQPHLYTRTRDFAADFAESLSKADRVVMPEIYPAREEPIEGVDSQMILGRIKGPEKVYCERKDLLNYIKKSNFEVLMTLGAADLNRLLPEISHILRCGEHC